MKSFDGFVILDNHMHLSPGGRLLSAVEMFIKAGGNAINLVNLPDHTISPLNYYEVLYRRTLDIAEKVREHFGLKVLVTIGPYPVDFFHFEKNSMNGFEAMKEGLYLAEELIESGFADAVGELGRPHFQYSPDRTVDFNKLLQESFRICHRLNVPAILHTEDLNESSYRDIEAMADSSGMDYRKIVKHHALVSDINIDTRLSLSILASRGNVRNIPSIEKRILLETDYVDDPRSWKVIPPDSVPRRAAFIRESNESWEAIFNNMFRRTPVEIYGEDAFSKLI